MKGRYVLRYRGEGTKPEADVERIRRHPETDVLDDSSTRMVVVDSPEAHIQELVGTLPDWIMAPDQQFAVPDTRKRVQQPPA